MLSLYLNYYAFVNFIFMWGYLLSRQLLSVLLFYPTGILLSILIVWWLTVLFCKVRGILNHYYRFFNYWVALFNSSRYIASPVLHIWLIKLCRLIGDSLYFFGLYSYIFYIKRAYCYVIIGCFLVCYIY